MDRSLLLHQTSVIRFSSTIGTNTILTRSGPKLGLVVTARQERSLYGAAEGGQIFQFLAPDMVRGIKERVSPAGQVEQAPDAEDVEHVVRSLADAPG